MPKVPKLDTTPAVPNEMQQIKISSQSVGNLEGALQTIKKMLDESGISDVMINNCKNIFLEKDGQIYRAPFTFSSDELVLQTAYALISAAGKDYVAEESFVVDGMLPEGHRLTVVLPPASLGSATINIRRFQRKAFSLDKMVESGLVTQRLERF